MYFGVISPQYRNGELHPADDSTESLNHHGLDYKKVFWHDLQRCKRREKQPIALKVWQPEAVRGMQKQMVEQYDVPVESRISAQEMKLRLCKQQIANYDSKALRVENQKVDRAKEQLESVKYHPLHDLCRKGSRSDEHGVRRKKWKHV
ncbi:F-box protein SKIP24-like [Coffea arabica]|uniref:F-box protein SKIP24-like n=1 Tax=Coffea arabica TaxID=13443 RepID=A0ABM4X7R7_COFAR